MLKGNSWFSPSLGSLFLNTVIYLKRKVVDVTTDGKKKNILQIIQVYYVFK